MCFVLLADEKFLSAEEMGGIYAPSPRRYLPNPDDQVGYCALCVWFRISTMELGKESMGKDGCVHSYRCVEKVIGSAASI